MVFATVFLLGMCTYGESAPLSSIFENPLQQEIKEVVHTPEKDPGPKFWATRKLFLAIQGAKPPRDIAKILKSGADINGRDEGRDLEGNPLYLYDEGETPLLLASRYWAQSKSRRRPDELLSGRLREIVEFLANEKEVDISAVDKYGNTVLMHLAQAGDVKLVEKLITAGADVNALDNGGWGPESAEGSGFGGTALLRAIFDNRAEVAHLLLSRKANVNLGDKDKRSPLLWALKQANDRPDMDFSATIASVTAHNPAGINSPDLAGNTPLIGQVLARRVKNVKALLLASSLNVNARNSAGCAAFVEAAKLDLPEVVTALSERSNKLRYAYFLLSLTRDVETRSEVGPLLLDPNLSCYDGTTALTAAAKHGSPESIKAILKVIGIDVNLSDREGPALIHAVRSRAAKAVEALLSHEGLDPNFKDTNGNTALIIASELFRLDILKVLLKHSSIDLNISGLGGRTALIAASRANWADGVAVLLGTPGLDVNLRDQEGRSALDWARQNRQERIIGMLILAGAQ